MLIWRVFAEPVSKQVYLARNVTVQTRCYSKGTKELQNLKGSFSDKLKKLCVKELLQENTSSGIITI